MMNIKIFINLFAIFIQETSKIERERNFFKKNLEPNMILRT